MPILLEKIQEHISHTIPMSHNDPVRTRRDYCRTDWAKTLPSTTNNCLHSYPLHLHLYCYYSREGKHPSRNWYTHQHRAPRTWHNSKNISRTFQKPNSGSRRQDIWRHTQSYPKQGNSPTKGHKLDMWCLCNLNRCIQGTPYHKEYTVFPVVIR